MSDRDDIARLQQHIGALRERAAQARRLATDIMDRLARDGLSRHAEEFEHRAAALEAELAALSEAPRHAEPGEPIAALGPAGSKPASES